MSKKPRNFVARDMAHKFKSKSFDNGGNRRPNDQKNHWMNEELLAEGDEFMDNQDMEQDIEDKKCILYGLDYGCKHPLATFSNMYIAQEYVDNSILKKKRSGLEFKFKTNSLLADYASYEIESAVSDIPHDPEL